MERDLRIHSIGEIANERISFNSSHGEVLRLWETVCRNIRILFNFDPPATTEEIRDASLQFVRKISGFSKPSKMNEQSFRLAVDEIALASTRLLDSLETDSTPRNRVAEAARAKARAAVRFGG